MSTTSNKELKAVRLIRHSGRPFFGRPLQQGRDAWRISLLVGPVTVACWVDKKRFSFFEGEPGIDRGFFVLDRRTTSRVLLLADGLMKSASKEGSGA